MADCCKYCPVMLKYTNGEYEHIQAPCCLQSVCTRVRRELWDKYEPALRSYEIDRAAKLIRQKRERKK